MPLRKRKEPRDSQHYARGSTKKRTKLKSSIRPWQVLTLGLCGLMGIILALVWGNHLKARSDALRDEQARNDWTVNPHIAKPAPVEVPDIRAVAIKPEGNVGDILIAGKHDGVILPLCGQDGIPLYASEVGSSAGMAPVSDAPSLTADIARISKRGLRVTVVYAVTCFSATDAPTAIYKRGLDMALLRECAEARPDDILLLGLPAGNDTADRKAVDFLSELDGLLAGLPDCPAIGVALPPSAFASDTMTRGDGFSQTSSQADEGTEAEEIPLYAGNISPARLLAACDYLAMDLRNMSAVGVNTLLPDIQFAYVHHSLRLLVNLNDRDAVDSTLAHGFERVFEMEPPPMVSGTENETYE